MSYRPYVKIIEQPRSRGIRFRYNSERRLAGTITGAHSTFEKKSYPTIQIMNYRGPVFIVVSCVSKDEPFRPHPFNIMVKTSDDAQGIFYYRAPANQSIISFPHLGIECIKKKDVRKSLEERERLNVDPFKTGFYHKYDTKIIDLTCLRLCFQVFIEGRVKGIFNVPLDPVVTAPIYDRKITGDLKIWWISNYSAPISGGSVICILCEKVIKDDIEVCFYDLKTKWEAVAEFFPPRYHKHVALIFKTPKYNVQDVDEPVQVHVQLRRPSDDEVSNSVPFEFIPEECASEDGFRRKRRKFYESPRDLVLRHMREKTGHQHANTNMPTNAAFPILGSQPLGLYNPNIIAEKPVQFSSCKKMNICSEKPSTSNTMAYDYNQSYHNNQPTIDVFNQLTSTMNTGLMQQMINPNNNYPNYDHQYNNNVLSQQRNRNFSYLDEFVKSMMDQNYKNP